MFIFEILPFKKFRVKNSTSCFTEVYIFLKNHLPPPPPILKIIPLQKSEMFDKDIFYLNLIERMRPGSAAAPDDIIYDLFMIQAWCLGSQCSKTSFINSTRAYRK